MTADSKIRERFDRIEGYIDFLYDTAYGAIDAVFYTVDRVYGALKRRAYEHAERVSGGSESTPLGKAYALADYYEENGLSHKASFLRKFADKGIVDVKGVEDAWDGINAPGKTYTSETPDVPPPA